MFTEELSVFLDTDDFATAVTVDGDSVDVIFEDTWVELTIGNVPYSGIKPTVFGRKEDFEGKNGEIVVVGSVSYTIIDIQPDGSGMVLVILTEL